MKVRAAPAPTARAAAPPPARPGPGAAEGGRAAAGTAAGRSRPETPGPGRAGVGGAPRRRRCSRGPERGLVPEAGWPAAEGLHCHGGGRGGGGPVTGGTRALGAGWYRPRRGPPGRARGPGPAAA